MKKAVRILSFSFIGLMGMTVSACDNASDESKYSLLSTGAKIGSGAVESVGRAVTQIRGAGVTTNGSRVGNRGSVANRAERFQRAEKLAMEAPVKLILPLIVFIFPVTFIVLAFPIAMKFLMEGML